MTLSLGVTECESLLDYSQREAPGQTDCGNGTLWRLVHGLQVRLAGRILATRYFDSQQNLGTTVLLHGPNDKMCQSKRFQSVLARNAGRATGDDRL